MSFKEFQEGGHGCHLGYGNGRILAILNLCVTVMPPIKFWLNPTYSLGGDVLWRISRWPLGYLNRMILAILNLCLTVMPPIKFQLNRTWFGKRCHLKNFKMAAMAAILDSEWNDFSNSESLCHCNASHQVSAQSDLRFGRRCHLKYFKMATMAAILDIGTEPIYQFWISMLPQCLPLSFTSIRLTVQEEMSKTWKINDGRTDGRQTDNGQHAKLQVS